MIRAGELSIKRQVTRAVRPTTQTDSRAGAAARNISIDRLANARLQLDQVSRQVDDYVALFPVYGIELDSKFRSRVIGLAATVSSHASHISAEQLIAEKRKRSTFNAHPNHDAGDRELKTPKPSVMDGRESLAERNHRGGDFRDYVRADQRAPAENFSAKPACGGFVRSSVDGFNRRDNTRTRISRRQLRYARSLTRNDADLGVSLSGAFFRVGG